MEPARPARQLIAAGAALAAACALAGQAAGSGGGVETSDPPRLTGVTCIEQCAGERVAAVGSIVRLDGRDLDQVGSVRFAGPNGRIEARPRRAGARSVEAKVPQGAVTGTVKVDAYGSQAETPRDEPLRIVAENEIPAGGQFRLTSAQATPQKSFYDGVAPPTLTYLFQGSKATAVRVEVVDRESKEVVSTWVDEDAEPNSRNTTRWHGRSEDGSPAANGEYKFKIGSASEGGLTTTVDARFGYYKFRFPIAARHSYGDGFGAGRGHQGQDVFAKCGTTLRAARGGRVQWNKTHAAAGNYLVIDGKGTRTDFMYAHMKRRSPLQRGDRVRTGQKIGLVGDTGNASGCHLHFEVWSGPGWYEGGQALPSVARLLRAWDRWS